MTSFAFSILQDVAFNLLAILLKSEYIVKQVSQFRYLKIYLLL